MSGLRSSGIVSFDSQIIIEYLAGIEGAVIVEGTDNIIIRGNQKGISTHRVTIRSGKINNNANRLSLSNAKDFTSSNFRLYLRGHGDFKMQQLGGRYATEVSQNVIGLGLEFCQLISITGCQLARAAVNNNGISTTSFASEFHRLISNGGTTDEKKIPIFAREESVGVANEKIANNYLDMWVEFTKNGVSPPFRILDIGSKNDESRASKKVFTWKDGKQMMTDAALFRG